MRIPDLLSDDDTGLDLGGDSIPNAITGRQALLKAALLQTGLADLPATLAAEPGQYVLITTPTAAWALGLARHLQNAFSAAHVRAVTELRKDGNRGLAAELEEFLSSGTALVVVSQDPETLLLSGVWAAADVTLDLDPPDVALVRRAIRELTEAPVPELENADILGLDFDTLAAALRRGSTPETCIARLRRASQGRRKPGAEDKGPRVADLPLSPEISAWSAQLLADLRQVEAGTMRPADLSYPVLEGPPGTGKTLIAGALARSAGWRLVATSMGSWFSGSDGHLGGVSKAIVEFFNEVLREPYTVGLIDEIDAIPNRAHLSPKDREWWTPVVTLVLLQIDRLRRSGKPVVLVGAANFYDHLDAALIRSGRLEHRVAVLPPRTVDDVARVFEHYLEGSVEKAAVSAAARFALGWTPADIEAAVRAARGRAAAADRAMEPADLLESVAPHDTRSEAELRMTAVHEAGHAIVSLSLGLPVESVSIVADGPSGGFTKGSVGSRVPTREELEAIVTVTLGGRAADIALGAGANAGAEQDLAMATTLMARAMDELGLYDRLTHSAAWPHWRHADEWLEPMLQRLLKRALQIVQHHREAVLDLAEQLLGHRVLDGAAVERIYKAHRVEPERIAAVEGSLGDVGGPAS